MHLYNKSEELVKELEQAVQQEENKSRKSQYQTILQTQRNISSNLKTLGEANKQMSEQKQMSEHQEPDSKYSFEFSEENHLNTSMFTGKNNNENMKKNEGKKQSDKDSN